ncbi:copper chaperone PCu(A)C [Sphingopyxis sp. GC21]|uniref:copper chaperone PCu(A)C n=1 Tax=Sphingopyxis sp. GC21 TaxID=2933562 RepID=UPI0021E3EA5E|nr:copper chaperone PCu(A)C [Sphingopyxis sp. GC21]
MIPHPKILALGTAASLIAGTALADGRQTGLSVQHAWSRETAAGQAVGGGFLTITNSGSRDERLLSGTTPVAAEVQLHTMTMDGGVMRMRQVTDGIAIPAKGSVELKPGSYHIMFMGLRRQLRQGERFPVALRFQRAGSVTVQFTVQPVAATGPMEGSHAGH